MAGRGALVEVARRAVGAALAMAACGRRCRGHDIGVGGLYAGAAATHLGDQAPGVHDALVTNRPSWAQQLIQPDGPTASHQLRGHRHTIVRSPDISRSNPVIPVLRLTRHSSASEVSMRSNSPSTATTSVSSSRSKT